VAEVVSPPSGIEQRTQHKIQSAGDDNGCMSFSHGDDGLFHALYSQELKKVEILTLENFPATLAFHSVAA
jgi:hypothetical protein